MTASTLRATIDDALGPGHSRYFGHGFRRVTHHLTDLDIRATTITGTLTATARVDYPPDWSTKATQPTEPHLSTLDALIIAGQLAEAYLTHGHRLDPATRARMWLRAFTMHAGATAQIRLTDMAVHGHRTGMRLGPWGTNTVISAFDFRIGTIRLSCQIQHDLGTPVLKPAAWTDIARLLGDAANRHYGRGFAHRTQDIRSIEVDADQETARATITVTDPQLVPPEGMAASYEPALSFLDATAGIAQLAQVLAYQREGVTRTETDTLWMRRFTMHRDTPTLPLADPIPMTARVTRRRRIDRMNRSWRLYQMAGDIGGIHAAASLAFDVPGTTDTRGGQK